MGRRRPRATHTPARHPQPLTAGGGQHHDAEEAVRGGDEHAVLGAVLVRLVRLVRVLLLELRDLAGPVTQGAADGAPSADGARHARAGETAGCDDVGEHKRCRVTRSSRVASWGTAPPRGIIRPPTQAGSTLVRTGDRSWTLRVRPAS